MTELSDGTQPENSGQDEKQDPPTGECHLEALESMLKVFFETSDASLLDSLEEKIAFENVPAGETLFEEGDPGDDVYFVLSGRMRAVRKGDGGVPMTLGEIGRGETIGELAFITGESRSAAVHAVRDSVVARLGRSSLEAILANRPPFALSLARIAVERFRQTEKARQSIRRPVSICVLPVTQGVNAEQFVRELAACRENYGGPVKVLTREDAVRQFGEADCLEGGARRQDLADWLTRQEADVGAIFLLATHSPDAWAELCLRQADEVVLLADADQAPVTSALEQQLFDGDKPAPEVFQSLVLLHPADRRTPTHTSRWLDRRPVNRHFHVRSENRNDLQRVARTLAGRAVGIVLAGGGARAFSHFGVLNALCDFGIRPDFLGGTSMGATAAGWRAIGLEGKAYIDAGRRVYMSKPTNDFNPLPLLSFLRGGKVRHLAERAIMESVGSSIDVEDTWIPFFCIATNLSTSDQAVLNRGPMAKSLLASFSIPGALPPVILNKHLMVDGGTFNNFPVDVMEDQGVGSIIGLAMKRPLRGEESLSEIPGSLSLLLDRFRRKEKRQFSLPLLHEIFLSASLSASHSRQRQAKERVNLLLQPDTSDVNLMDWHRFDEVVETGYNYATEILSSMSPEELDRFR